MLFYGALVTSKLMVMTLSCSEAISYKFHGIQFCRWRVRFRGNFGTFRASRSFSDCIRLRHRIVVAGVVVTTRNCNPQTERNLWRTKWTRSGSKSYFRFPGQVADIKQKRFCSAETDKQWSRRSFIVIQIFQTRKQCSLRLNNISNWTAELMTRAVKAPRACLAAWPIHSKLYKFHKTII